MDYVIDTITKKYKEKKTSKDDRNAAYYKIIFF